MSLPEDRSSNSARTYRTERFDRTDPVHVGLLRSSDNDIMLGAKGTIHIPARNGKPVEAGKAYEKEDLPRLKEEAKEEASAKSTKNTQKPGAALDRAKADEARNARIKARKAAEGKK